MESPLAAIDRLISPIIIAANVVRQARDALPAPVWQLVPPALRTPMDALFLAVENYDRKVGQMKTMGLL